MKTTTDSAKPKETALFNVTVHWTPGGMSYSMRKTFRWELPIDPVEQKESAKRLASICRGNIHKVKITPIKSAI